MNRTIPSGPHGIALLPARWYRWMFVAAALVLLTISAHAQPCNPAVFTVNVLPTVPSCAYPLQLEWNFGPFPGLIGSSPNIPAAGVYNFPAPAGPGGPLFLNWAQVASTPPQATPIPINTWYHVSLGPNCCCCVQLNVTNVGGCWIITVDKGGCPP
ncbi:MAG: hypothetical protein JWQ98_2495 [Chlorobi bacterium]|nr:hypothetical protein [Chlorobiota bacterium]